MNSKRRNRTAGSKSATQTKGKKVVKKNPAKQPAVINKSKCNYPRHPSNPFRPLSSYGKCFDILASVPDGIHREKLSELLAKETGKKLRLAGYDMAVLLSAREEAVNGKRHRSCKDGFYVKRTNDHVQLVLS